ncbi:MAG: response regulator [Defluviitaleaceae bacterium]|nr:response regulator [Defluviitaleaceae bacterium]
MKTIFIVDDNTINLHTAKEVLSDQYKVITLSSASIMFEFLENVVPDLILLDIIMPELDGFGALKRLRADKRHEMIPVIFLTSKSDADTEALGFEMGVVDFIHKPFSPPVLLNRIKTHLNIDGLIRERTKKLVEQAEELLLLKNGLVFTMADLVENRDNNTGGHVDRTAMYMKLLIDEMHEQGIYDEEMEGWNIESVVSSARLHDVGKIAIADSILNKPAKLTSEEYEIMKTHSMEGARIIDNAIGRTGSAEFLHNARTIALYHHERWDGTGYPHGLKGTEIPLLGRMMAVVDVYDAIVSARSYKEQLPNDTAIFIIGQESGKHFEPIIAKTFIEAIGKYYSTDAANSNMELNPNYRNK